MKSDLIARALKIAAARDDLLAARVRRSKARLAWGNACKNASIIDAQGRWLPKFVFDDEYDSYRATADFVKVAPWYLEGDFVDNNECFIAWYAAGKEKYEANKAHGIALRRLLQIGVKPSRAKKEPKQSAQGGLF